MSTGIDYVHHKREKQRDHASIRIPKNKAKAAILKIVKRLSFDGGNIFKSKKWPYY